MGNPKLCLLSGGRLIELRFFSEVSISTYTLGPSTSETEKLIGPSAHGEH